MDYGNLFSRAWNLIWDNKALIFLGMLAVLSGVGSGGGGSQGFSGNEGDFNFQSPSFFDFQYSRPFQGLGLPVLAVGVIVVLLLVALLLWSVGTIARGGLITGAVAADQGQEVLFGEAFRKGIDKGWRLIGIGLIPAIPVVLLAGSALISADYYSGSRVTSFEGLESGFPNAAVFTPVIAVTCLLVLLALGLSLLRAFANRACMLEDLGVLASYRRGFEVLGNNLGPALILYLLQILLSIGLSLLLLAPLALSLLCCALWPLLWFVQGTFAAFYSTLWTLAWQKWGDIVPAR